MHAYWQLIIPSALLGLLTGGVLHRSDFCFAGMFRDLFLFRQTFMLRILLLLIVFSMLLFETARRLGLLSSYPFPMLDPPSLVSLLGGFVFGIGMILAGGCVVGTLYKCGSGSVLGGLALSGLVIGSALYAEIHPFWAKLYLATRFGSGQITLPQFLGISPSLPVLAALTVGGGWCLRWQRRGALVRPGGAEGYLQPWRAALCLAGLGLASWLLVGMPLGITTAYTKIGAVLEGWLLPAHAAGLGYFHAESLSYVPPFTATPLQGGPGPQWDAVAAIQIPLVAGIVLGSALSALQLGEFRPYLRVPRRQALSALAGGIIMGLAARLGQACNVWHLLGGLPVLAVQSLLFLAGLFPGAWLGSRLLLKLVLR